jgi:hypothetical protein
MVAAMQHAADGTASCSVPVRALDDLVEALMLLDPRHDRLLQTGFAKK